MLAKFVARWIHSMIEQGIYAEDIQKTEPVDAHVKMLLIAKTSTNLK